jgi:hypothetical protein
MAVRITIEQDLRAFERFLPIGQAGYSHLTTKLAGRLNHYSHYHCVDSF